MVLIKDAEINHQQCVNTFATDFEISGQCVSQQSLVEAKAVTSTISFRRNISGKNLTFYFLLLLCTSKIEIYIRQDIISVILDVIEHGPAKS